MREHAQADLEVVFDDVGQDRGVHANRAYVFGGQEWDPAALGSGVDQILKYDLEGRLLNGWGTFGPFPGGLWGVHQVSVDSEGNLYVADYNNNRVLKFVPKAGADPARLVSLVSV